MVYYGVSCKKQFNRYLAKLKLVSKYSPELVRFVPGFLNSKRC